PLVCSIFNAHSTVSLAIFIALPSPTFYTLSLHDALPIYPSGMDRPRGGCQSVDALRRGRGGAPGRPENPGTDPAHLLGGPASWPTPRVAEAHPGREQLRGHDARACQVAPGVLPGRPVQRGVAAVRRPCPTPPPARAAPALQRRGAGAADRRACPRRADVHA